MLLVSGTHITVAIRPRFQGIALQDHDRPAKAGAESCDINTLASPLRALEDPAGCG